MENDDTSNLFKDFKYPDDPKGISKAPKPRPLMEEQASEEDRIKMGYKKAEQSLEEKSRKNTARHLKAKTMPNYERIAYIAIILVLGAYISIDFGFYHGSNDIAGSADEKLATGAAIKLGGKGNASKDTASVNISKNAAASAADSGAENKSNGASNETGKAEEKEKSGKNASAEGTADAAIVEKKLSGSVALTLDKIYSEEADIETEYISKVDFTIDNGKEKGLTPILDVYAFDSEMDKSWEIRSRGQYKGSLIEAGGKQSGSVFLTPKTFRNLKIEKSIRLSLNDTKDGFVAAVNQKITIS